MRPGPGQAVPHWPANCWRTLRPRPMHGAGRVWRAGELASIADVDVLSTPEMDIYQRYLKLTFANTKLDKVMSRIVSIF